MIFFIINYCVKEMTTYTLTLENWNNPIPIETTTLICKNLHLAQLPESIGNLIHLKELHCSDNQLQELPKTPVSTCESIRSLIHLQVLDCGDNQLQELPKTPVSTCEWIGDFTNLQILYCGNNQLTMKGIPESIGNLINLQQLFCGNNQLQELPKTPVSTCESIGNLINLQILHCRHNQLKHLPKTPVSTCECIGNLINLQHLRCNGNRFKKEVNDIICKYNYYDTNAQELLQELRDAYLISTDNSFILK
jgi:Leucine-rich repeat (LRR) protein